MIPKIIHYCWFGRNPLPPLAQKCIASWRRFLPDYEIREWNEDNFDVYSISYTRDAYATGKFAFVSDYARFWILHRYGGLYFDTDVEIIRSLDHIISAGPFMARETPFDCFVGNADINPGLGLGALPQMPVFSRLLDAYGREAFDPHHIEKTVVHITSEILMAEGYRNTDGISQVAGLNIYPADYFCPIHIITKRMKRTSNTVAIHWYCGSWRKRSMRDNILAFMQKLVPERFLILWNRRRHPKR